MSLSRRNKYVDNELEGSDTQIEAVDEEEETLIQNIQNWSYLELDNDLHGCRKDEAATLGART